MYVTYNYYRASFGNLIPAESFLRAEREAEAHIRALTFVNGDVFAEESNLIKMAVCAAAEVIYQTQQRGGAGIKSESNDGYSVSYVAEATDGKTVEEVTRKKVYETIRLYLLPTGWMSRKVKVGGGCCDDCDRDNHL